MARREQIKKLILIPVITIVFTSYYNSKNINPSLFSVKVKGFSSRVYFEKRSKFLIFSSDKQFNLPDTPFQRIIKNRLRNGGREILVLSGVYAKKNVLLNQYTADTRLLNIHSPAILRLRKRFIGSRDRIRMVKQFVYRHITDKTIGIPLISAVDILKSRSGDCTEHTVLTVSILRSMKIPSRAVVGMILCREFLSRKNVFVFHMWAEAFFNGRWFLVDSTRPNSTHPNRYIAFSYHSLKTEVPLSYLKAVASIKDLEINFISSYIPQTE